MDKIGSAKTRKEKSPLTLFKRQGCGVSSENATPATYTRTELHELIKQHYPHYIRQPEEENE